MIQLAKSGSRPQSRVVDSKAGSKRTGAPVTQKNLPAGINRRRSSGSSRDVDLSVKHRK